jgi:hypothetical protein
MKRSTHSLTLALDGVCGQRDAPKRTLGKAKFSTPKPAVLVSVYS